MLLEDVRVPTVGALAMLMLLAGCASDDADDEPPTPAPGVEAVALEVAATGLYPATPAFTPEQLHVMAGAPVSLTFSNDDVNLLVVHNWVLDGVEGAQTADIAPGETTTLEFVAPAAGEYAYYCSIGDHRSRGMEGTLHVAA